MKAFLLCIILITSSMCAMSMMDKYPTIFRNKRSIMSVMIQVEAQIKAKGPYDAVTRILQEYADEIMNEQAAHDQLWAETKGECEDEQAFRKNAISDAEAALHEAKDTLESCVTQQQRAQSDKVISEKQLTTARVTLANIVTQRRTENEAYNKLQTAFVSLLQGIDGANSFLAKFEPSSFVELAKHTNTILLQASQVQATRHLADIMKVMVQVAAQSGKVDGALLQRLRDLFAEFRSKTLKQQKQSIQGEQKAVEVFNAAKTRLEATVDRLFKQIEDLKFELAQLKTCISMQTSLVVSSESKLARNQLLFDDSVRMCDSAFKQYTEATAARKDENQLLQAITVAVQKRFGEIEGNTEPGMQGNAAVRRGKLSGEQMDNSYVNKSDFKDKDFVWKDGKASTVVSI